MKIKGEITAEELLKILDNVPLNKNELRRAIRPAAQQFFEDMRRAVRTGWGIRTGRMAGEGVKMGIATRDEQGGGAAYRIYFSTKKGTRGKKDYIAPTYVARWLEGGTEPHYTAKGATIKKMKRGKIFLNGHQRKLKHPGFIGRPVAEKTQEAERNQVESVSRKNILNILRKKGVKDA